MMQLHWSCPAEFHDKQLFESHECFAQAKHCAIPRWHEENGNAQNQTLRTRKVCGSFDHACIVSERAY